MQKTQVWCFIQDNPLEKEMATPSSILTWRTPRTEEPGATVYGVAKSCTQLSNEHPHFWWPCSVQKTRISGLLTQTTMHLSVHGVSFWTSNAMIIGKQFFSKTCIISIILVLGSWPIRTEKGKYWEMERNHLSYTNTCLGICVGF